MTDLLIELPEFSVVRRSSVILIVAPELGVEGFLLLVHRCVAVFLAPFGDCRQAPAKPLLHRSYDHLSGTGDTGGAQFPGDPPNHADLNNSKGIVGGYTAVLRNNLVNSFDYG
jgi:hypothetical protein